MKNLIQLVVLLCAPLALAHSPNTASLSFKNDTLHIHASFVNPPRSGMDSEIVLEARNALTRQPAELNDSIDVSLWMPSMGHGSAPTQVTRAIDAKGNVLLGVYNVRNVYFIMGGDWEVRITLTDISGRQESQKFSLFIDEDHGEHHH